MAKIVDDRLLLGFADAVGRPLLSGEIDLQMLMGKNPAVNGGDISGHGSDHCWNPISDRAEAATGAHSPPGSRFARQHPSAR